MKQAEEKPIFAYSNARTEYDVDPNLARKHPSSIALLVLAGVLMCWVLFSLIYRLTTETHIGRVWLEMLPSLILTAFIIAIAVLSFIGAWGKVARFALRHGLYQRGDAMSRERLRAMQVAFDRADANKPKENALRVTRTQVELTLYGRKEVFDKADVTARVRRENGALLLTLRLAGNNVDFPEPIPQQEYYRLHKAFGDKLTTVRNTSMGKRRGGESVASIVGGAVMSFVVLAAGVMLTVTHYLWVENIPPFLGVFFALMSLLCFGNTFSFIDGVTVVLIPLCFSLVLLVVPPWIFVWYETTLALNPLTFWGVLTHADVFPVGMAFFSVLGVIVFIFAVNKGIEFRRFGK